MMRDRRDQDEPDFEGDPFDRDEDVGDEEDDFDPFDDDAGEELCDHGNHPATCEWCFEEWEEDQVASVGADDEREGD